MTQDIVGGYKVQQAAKRRSERSPAPTRGCHPLIAALRVRARAEQGGSEVQRSQTYRRRNSERVMAVAVATLRDSLVGTPAG